MMKMVLTCRRFPGFSFFIVSFVMLFFVLSGCALRHEDYYGNVRRQREQTYRQWYEQREKEEKRQPFMEGELSLEEALETALVHNQSLRSVLQEKAIAEGMIQESFSQILPQLRADADYTRLGDVQEREMPPELDIDIPDITDTEQDLYSIGLRLTQPLFRGGSILSGIRSAHLSSLVADEEVREATQEVIYEVTRSYYDILLAHQLLQVNTDAVESAKAHLKNVQARYRQGVATHFDVLRAQVDVSLYEAEKISQQNKIHLATTDLLRTMGVCQDSEVELTEELVYAPYEGEYEEMVQSAYEKRPDLFQAELAIQLQEESVITTRSQYFPTVEAWIGQEWARPDPVTRESEWGDTWRAGVTLSFTLFDGFRRAGQMQQERSRLEQRHIDLREAEDYVVQQVRGDVLSIRDARELVSSQSLNVERAKEALRLAEAGYREGIMEAVEVTEAREALTRAHAAYYEAVHSHATAVLSLKRATGQLGPQPGETGGNSWLPSSVDNGLLFINNPHVDKRSEENFDRKGDR